MAKGYREVWRDQPFLLPPDMRDLLGRDHPVLLVIRVVEEHLDTSAFHGGRRTGGAGAAGYDPDMLLILLVWAYANRVTSSRRIEQLCRSDLAFLVICAGNHPDHSTISRFREQAGDAMAVLFGQVLGLCAQLGMARLGTVALDGTKVAASASKSANRSLRRLRELGAEIAAEHAARDAAEDARFGAGIRGDEVPEEVRSPQSLAGERDRDERISRALAELEAEEKAAAEAAREDQAAKTAEFRARKAAGQRTGPAPAGSEAELAQEKLDRETAAQQAKIDDWNARDAAARAATGKGLSRKTRPGSPAGSYVRVRQAAADLDRARARETARDAARARERGKRTRNTTDPDSRLMPVRGGAFIQGYNAQNLASEDGLIIATRLTGTPGDVTWFEPMLAAAEAAAAFIASRQPPAARTAPRPRPAASPDTAGTGCACGTCGRCLIGLVLADAGYKSEDNMTCPGPDRLIATGKHRDLEKKARAPGAPPGPGQPDGPATAAMAERLKTEQGITAYRQRGHIAETPHASIKHNLGFRQFTMRGTTRTTAEWHLITTVHNLLTAITSGHLTTQALTAL